MRSSGHDQIIDDRKENSYELCGKFKGIIKFNKYKHQNVNNITLSVIVLVATQLPTPPNNIRETVCLTTQMFFFFQFQQTAEMLLKPFSNSLKVKVLESEFQQFAESTFSNSLKVFVSNAPAESHMKFA